MAADATTIREAGDAHAAPGEGERREAMIAASRLGQVIARRPDPGQDGPVGVVIRDHGGESVEIEIPPSALTLFHQVLVEMANGNAVALRPIREQLTTQEAANELGVSRPYLVKLLDRGEIPHAMVGTHRRVLRRDLMEYKARVDGERSRVLDQLVAEAQELGMGY